MAVHKRTWKTSKGEKRSAWQVQFTYTKPSGEKIEVRKTAPGNTKREAKAYERELLAAIHNGTYGTHEEKDVPAFTAYADEWLETYVKTHCKPSTLRTRKSALRAHIKPFFGKMKLDEIGKRDIARFKSKLLDKELSRKTVNNHLGILSSLLNTAVEWEVIESAPKVTWLKTPDPKFDFLDFNEADRLIEASEPEIRPMVFVAIKTGMRLGEMLALRWQDVDLVKGEIHVQRSATRGKVSTPKSGRNRVIALSPNTVAVLKKHRPHSKLRGELVFSNKRGELQTRDMVKRPLKRACRKAGLRHITWHDLRHTYASHLVMHNVPMKTVQELLGHATMEMTMRYAHLSESAKHSAVKRLDRTPPIEQSAAE